MWDVENVIMEPGIVIDPTSDPWLIINMGRVALATAIFFGIPSILGVILLLSGLTKPRRERDEN